MNPTIDRLSIYLLKVGLQPHTAYTIYEGPEGLTHTTQGHKNHQEGFLELVSFTTDEDPPQTLSGLHFLLTYETDGWSCELNTKQGKVVINLSGHRPPLRSDGQ